MALIMSAPILRYCSMVQGFPSGSRFQSTSSVEDILRLLKFLMFHTSDGIPLYEYESSKSLRGANPLIFSNFLQ